MVGYFYDDRQGSVRVRLISLNVLNCLYNWWWNTDLSCNLEQEQRCPGVNPTTAEMGSLKNAPWTVREADSGMTSLVIRNSVSSAKWEVGFNKLSPDLDYKPARRGGNVEKTYRFYTRKKKKTRFFVLYSDKTWVFDQSEHMQGPI